ncbi:MAG: hypothetical protein WBM34_00420 [Woeseiaceae bacterium]
MLIGLLMILVPVVVYVITIPLSRRLNPGLRKTYRVIGGIVVFLGSGISIYFASYTGDQGGIAAFYFQILVILVYAALSLSVVIVNWILRAKEAGTIKS